MARTFFELPSDIIRTIMDIRVSLELADDPYLKMAHTTDLCYCCGDKNVSRHVRYNKINYKFCNFCIGYNNTLPNMASDHSRCYNLYKNYFDLKGVELVHFETLFHDVMEDETRESIKDPEMMREIFNTYIEFMPYDSDNDNVGHAFDWGESEDEVESP